MLFTCFPHSSPCHLLWVNVKHSVTRFAPFEALFLERFQHTLADEGAHGSPRGLQLLSLCCCPACARRHVRMQDRSQTSGARSYTRGPTGP